MIGYYLHHHGSGHRRRATAVGRELRSPVVGLGSGGPPPGWPGRWRELARDDEPAVVDEALADVTAGGVLHWVPRAHPGLLERHRSLVQWLADARPALVVVDVSVEVALLVRLCGVPVVVGGMPGERTDAVHALAYDLAEAILAPWPAGAHPDAGWTQDWWDKTWHVGGISALAGAGPGASGQREGAGPGEPGRTGTDGRQVLVLWGSGGEDLAEEQLASAREATPGWTWSVRGGGHTTADDEQLVAEIAAADVVVCHAGQGSVADVAAARRPAVVLAHPRPYDEQLATARAVDRMGLAASAVGWPTAGTWPGLLDRALERGGQGWAAWGGDGAQRAARRLDELVDRLNPHG